MQQRRTLTKVQELALRLTLIAGSVFLRSAVAARSEDAAWRPVPREAVFETGDTWRVGSGRYRLYGVQACLRNTAYTGQDGRRRDCGDASLSMLTGLVRALAPSCTAVARRPEAATAYMVCYADSASPRGKARVDLGTALIASGFAFAALDAGGRPVNPGYLAAELQAKTTRVGLWASPDLPHPNMVLLKALRGAPEGAP